ncbi:MAG TPA: ATP-binding cassette domain-containing protein [Blastocatellia bacterium]|jgi:osmoprotectant transport system ATP-binding protein|nr:ATP-binding cassette domain-containing protein [Blastocatellia bacterium]
MNSFQPTTREPVIEFRDVSLSVGGKALVAGLNFDVARGETLVLVGRSGSGKTTTLKLINRLLEPTAGEVRVEGKPTLEWDAIRLRRRVGYVIQETGLFPHFTVERNVALVPRLEGWPEGRSRERVRELLEMVGLAPDAFAGRFPQELSGGQRQRVGVARALAADPPVILMDEPFGALDPLTRVQLQREFGALASRLKKTIIFVTHDIREAFTLASRIGLFKDGRLVVLGEPSEFIASDEPEARAFLETLRVADFGPGVEGATIAPSLAGNEPETTRPEFEAAGPKPETRKPNELA